MEIAPYSGQRMAVIGSLQGPTYNLFCIDKIWYLADNFEKIQVIPILVITPLVYLGGRFYINNMLPDFWQKI